jgi:hypothetical protein
MKKLHYMIAGFILSLILGTFFLPSTAQDFTAGYTFIAGETNITHAKINSMISGMTVANIPGTALADTTIPLGKMAANSVNSSKIVDQTIVTEDVLTRGLAGTVLETNAVDSIALNTNQVTRSGFWYFTNVNTRIDFSGPSTTLNFTNSTVGFSANQIAGTSVAGVTNSAGASDAGKIVKLNDSGVISTSITPFSGFFTSTNITITAGGQVVNAHGLGASPSLIQARIKCTSADQNYSVNDEAIVSFGATDSSANIGVSVVPDATNLDIRFGSGTGGSTFVVPNKTTGAAGGIDNTKWQFIIRAWK